MKVMKFKQSNITYFLFIIVFIILVLSSFIVTSELTKRTKTSDLVIHTYHVITKIQYTVFNFLEANKQFQFYLYTHQNKFLTLNQTAFMNSQNALTELKTLTSDNMNQQIRINDIEQLMKKYTYLQINKLNYSNKSRITVDLTQEDIFVKEIKTLMNTMITEELSLLNRRTKRLEKQSHRTYVEASLSILLAFIILLTSFPIILKLTKKNEQQQLEKIQLEHEKLINQAMERAKLEFTLNAAKLGFWNLNLSDNTAERSLLHDQIFGYKSLLPKWTYEMFLTHIHPDDVKMVNQAFQNSTSTDSIWTFQCRIYRVDDQSLRWITATGKIFQIGEIRHMIGLVQDITERKQIEAQLAESEERWKFALESANHGVWDWHVPEKIIFFSPNWKSMLGYEENEIKNEQSEFESRVHPDDVKKVWDTLHDHFEGKTKEYNCEVRFRCKDGSYKWILDQGKVVSRSLDGQVLRAIGTHTDISDLKNTELKLKHDAEHDPLTGLANRTIFEAHLDEAIALSKRHQYTAAVLFIDIDEFKQINDAYGHLTGDLLLRATAKQIQLSLREMDTLARFGGDEFALLLPELKDENDVYKIIKKINQKFSKKILINNTKLMITLSIGIALYPKHGEHSLIEKADAAMYYVKQHGKNNFKLFEETIVSDK